MRCDTWSSFHRGSMFLCAPAAGSAQTHGANAHISPRKSSTQPESHLKTFQRRYPNFFWGKNKLGSRERSAQLLRTERRISATSKLRTPSSCRNNSLTQFTSCFTRCGLTLPAFPLILLPGSVCSPSVSARPSVRTVSEAEVPCFLYPGPPSVQGRPGGATRSYEHVWSTVTGISPLDWWVSGGERKDTSLGLVGFPRTKKKAPRWWIHSLHSIYHG